MAKSKPNSATLGEVAASDSRKWEVEDALRTLTRAHEIVSDKKLMSDVKKLAEEKRQEMDEFSHLAGQLAKMGRISPKAMRRMEKR